MTVSTVATAPQPAPEPSFWYGLPVGYVSLDLDPPTERLMETVRQLRELPEQHRDEADRALRLYAGIVGLLNSNRVQECALGVHPGDSGDCTTSVFTVSTLPTSGNSAKLVVAGLAGSAADGGREGMRALDLPCGVGFLSEKRSPAPRSSRLEANGAVPTYIWQGTVAVAAPITPELIVLQMVTPDLDSADIYRDILLGIARTLTFTDPAQTPANDENRAPEAPTGAAAAMRNDFG